MEKGIYIITATLLTVMLVYGCTDIGSILNFGDKETNDTTPKNEVSELFFTATLLQTEVYAKTGTSLTFKIENKWESKLENVTIKLEGFSYTVGTTADETQVVLNAGTADTDTHEISSILPNMVAQRQFRIFMPARLTTSINIRPVVCFDYQQMYRKDLVLMPEYVVISGSEVKPDGPLSISIPRSTILATDETIPTGGMEEYIEYSINKKNVDTIMSIKKLKVDIQVDDSLKGIESMTFLDKSTDIDILCTDKISCSLKEAYPIRQTGALNGLITVNVSEAVTSNTYKAVTMTVDGKYCTTLPELTLKVRTI